MRLHHLRCLCLTLLLAACASTNSAPSAPVATLASEDEAQRAAGIARSMLGKPYRYAGNTPAGFDCSGLVNYSYARVGLSVARNTRSLHQQTIRIEVPSLRAGDLVFFDQEGKKFSHVGIYLDHGAFVHAPSSGGRVRIDRLEDDYWRRHFVEARRI
jgi:murein DD-endopeptidase